MDCPEIVSVLRDGYRRKYLVPHCPICGCECERIAYSLDGEPVGCENCISWKDAEIEEEE